MRETKEKKLGITKASSTFRKNDQGTNETWQLKPKAKERDRPNMKISLGSNRDQNLPK